MNIIARSGCRLYQRGMQAASYLLAWRFPTVLQGAGALQTLPRHIRARGLRTVLIVTDRTLLKLGLIEPLLAELQNQGITFHIYADTNPDPDIENAEEAAELYGTTGCEAIIAFGGGSALDCGKAAAVRISRPDTPLVRLAGLLKVHRRAVPLYAVPTTAGTGSETTVAAVISDHAHKRKFAINDLCLIPDVAVLDPELLTALPADTTAWTGIDTLCHAIEARISKSTTADTREKSRQAVKLVFANLPESFANGGNLVARERMQQAAFLAGQAFTRAYVGYVHALAHAIGAFYHVPHGLANAVALPIVLEHYGAAVHRPLAELADVLGLTPVSASRADKSRAFIASIRHLNQQLDIPARLDCIRTRDIPAMVRSARTEAHPAYPAPTLLGAAELRELYTRIQGVPG